ncbi:MAG TPA: hypothetical protein VLH56_13300 [Dissulfurispiraceae bacterium]|nr:hypothetical protein [Dissulfurispiraceae bacterium]
MAKSDPVSEVAVQTETFISLEDFCLALSNTDKRVELLAAFHSVEKAEGRTHDTNSAYLSRFQQFLHRPA